MDRAIVGRGALTVTSVIRALDAGKVLHDLHSGLFECEAAVMGTGAKGKVVLTLTIEPGGAEGGVPRVVITGEVKVRAPRPGRMAQTFYVNDDMTLSLRDPRQPELPRIQGVESEAEAETA